MTSVYIGNYYEVAGTTVKKYYYAGSQRIAMKSGTTLYWLLADREPTGRGSTAVTVSGTTETGEVRYYPSGAKPASPAAQHQLASSGSPLGAVNTRRAASAAKALKGSRTLG
ncbi:MAG: hypothetical protein R2867_12510 [Caldilineaceae bacterium]